MKSSGGQNDSGLVLKAKGGGSWLFVLWKSLLCLQSFDGEIAAPVIILVAVSVPAHANGSWREEKRLISCSSVSYLKSYYFDSVIYGFPFRVRMLGYKSRILAQWTSSSGCDFYVRIDLKWFWFIVRTSYTLIHYKLEEFLSWKPIHTRVNFALQWGWIRSEYFIKHWH